MPQVVMKLANQPELIDCKNISILEKTCQSQRLRPEVHLESTYAMGKEEESSKQANNGKLTPQELQVA